MVVKNRYYVIITFKMEWNSNSNEKWNSCGHLFTLNSNEKWNSYGPLSIDITSLFHSKWNGVQIQMKNGAHIRVYKTNKESMPNFGQFISAKVNKTVSQSQAQFRKKLRKLSLRQNDSFLIEKRVYHDIFCHSILSSLQ